MKTESLVGDEEEEEEKEEEEQADIGSPSISDKPRR